MLPVAGQLERMDVITASSPRIMVAPAVVEPTFERRPVWWIAAQDSASGWASACSGTWTSIRSPELELTRAYFARGRHDLGDPLDVVPEGIALPEIYGYVERRVLPDGRWNIAPQVLLQRLRAENRRVA